MALSISEITAANNADLTAIGTSDWRAFGKWGTDDERMAVGGVEVAKISTVTGETASYANDPFSTNYTNGYFQTADASTSGYYGISTMSFSLSAGTTSQRLKVFCSHYDGIARIYATLSDPPTALSLDTTTAGGTVEDHDFEVVFAGSSAGTALTISLFRVSGTGTANFRAAALFPDDAPPPPVSATYKSSRSMSRIFR